MSRFTADLRRFEEHLQHEAETRLKTMAGHFSIDPSRIKMHVRFGNVRDMVNELANEIKADVVVIGSRNPSISTHLACSPKRHPPRPYSGDGRSVTPNDKEEATLGPASLYAGVVLLYYAVLVRIR